MMKAKRDKKGQMTVEMVLILTVLVGSAYLVKKELFDKPKNPFYRFVTEPWKSIAVMMESGVWLADPEEGRKHHPNHFKRIRAEKGKDPKT